MRAFLYQQKRRVDGRVITAKTWSAEIMLDGDFKPQRLSMKTRDRRVAQKRLDEHVAKLEREHARLLIPTHLVEAATKPLNKHAEDFIAELIATGRVNEYTRQIRSRLTRIMHDLAWSNICDLDADEFISWRQGLTVKPRTKNHFLDAMHTFCGWMLDQRRIEFNPFERVKRVSCPRGSCGNPRAFTDDEVRRLLDAAPDRCVVYLLAATTGLRFSELRRLQWGDVSLDTESPCIHLRAQATKSRRADTVWLHPDAAEKLRESWHGSDPTEPVLPTMPSAHTMNRDLLRAGIAKLDRLGRSASFHTFRRTFVTNMHRAGVDRRTAMAVSRHTSSRLTDVIYTDTESLPQRDAIQRLPSYMNQDEARTEMRTDDLDAGGESGSDGVATNRVLSDMQSPMNEAPRHEKTGPVATGQNPSINGAGGNRTPVPRQSAGCFYARSHSFDLSFTPGNDALCFRPAPRNLLASMPTGTTY